MSQIRKFDCEKECKYFIFRFGKHDSKPLLQVCKEDPEYISKMIEIKTNELEMFEYALKQSKQSKKLKKVVEDDDDNQ